MRETAQAAGQTEFADRFVGVEEMPAAQLSKCVVSALTFVQEKPEYEAIATQLAMVALNLKNLR